MTNNDRKHLYSLSSIIGGNDMSTNPFSTMFGKEPNLTIHRDDLFSEIVTDFENDNPSSQLYIITGARGSGKTVLLSEFYDYFDKQEDWISIDVNPHRNILEDIASALYEKGKMKKLFLKGTFDISFHGLTFRIEGKEPVTSIVSVVERMLTHLKNQNKKLIITLDEVTTSENVKEFAHDFQSFIRKNYPIYLLMTGIYENVMSLQNDRSITFLYRAPKILLEPLNLFAIQKSYMNTFNIDIETAAKLTNLTKGYGFGYQLLGHLYFDHNIIDEKLLDDYDESLRKNAYDKIYSSISESELKILKTLVSDEPKKTADILNETGYNNSTYSKLRERLINKGLVIAPRNGFLTLALPRFSNFLLDQEI